MHQQHARFGLLALSVALLNFSSAVAETVNFEDLNSVWFDLRPVPPEYAELTWVNFTSVCVDPLNCTGDKTGYLTGISGAVAVFNDNGLPAGFSSENPITFVGAYLTAVWPGGLEITVDGYLDAKLVKSMTVTVTPTASQLFTFNLRGVNKVIFTPSGGTPLSGNSGDRTFFVMDNLEITADDPEPTSITVDIKPGDSQNVINPKSKGVIPVAIPSFASFDATKLDLPLVGFGPDGAQPVKTVIEDVNGDGLLDVLLFFRTQSTGIACGDTSATLSVMTPDREILMEGTEPIRTVPCK